MNEAEWLACISPKPMLEFLRGRASDRKLRLFACACCRKVWHLMVDDRSRKAVEEAERYAEKLTSETALMTAVSDAKRALRSIQRQGATTPHAGAARAAASMGRIARQTAEHAANHAMWAEKWEGIQYRLASREGTKQTLEETLEAGLERTRKELDQIRLQQSALLHDIFGNPFRPAAIDSSWLTWSDGTVVKLGQGIYEDRAFDRLPVLADALDEAGCHDTDILAHCRQPGEHVRGCWVVELLLGKE